jgi:hypothetical protein
VAWTQALSPHAVPPRGPNAVRVMVRDRRGRWRGRSVGRTRHFLDPGLRLAVNARGDAVAAWIGSRPRRPGDVLLAATRRAAHTFTQGRPLGERGADITAAVDARGRAFVAWTRTLPPQHLQSRIRVASRAARGRWTTPVTIADGRVGGPKIALVPDGSLVLGWREQELGLGATRTGLPAVAARAAGGAWTASRTLSDIRTAGLQLGVSAAGDVLAVWSPAPPASGEPAERALYAAERPPSLDFGPVERAGGVLGGPLAVLARGTAVTVAAGAGIETAVRPPAGPFAPAPRITRTGDFPSLSSWGDVAAAVWLARSRLRASTFVNPAAATGGPARPRAVAGSP